MSWVVNTDIIATFSWINWSLYWYVPVPFSKVEPWNSLAMNRKTWLILFWNDFLLISWLSPLVDGIINLKLTFNLFPACFLFGKRNEVLCFVFLFLLLVLPRPCVLFISFIYAIIFAIINLLLIDKSINSNSW